MDAQTPDMQMSPEFKQAYQRVVLAGMKVLFSKNANQKLLPSGDPKDLAKSIINLVTTLFNQAKGKMPTDIIMPVATTLLIEAHQMLEKSGEADKESIGEAFEWMVPTLLKNFGVPVEQIEQMFAQAEKQAPNEATEEEAPGDRMTPAAKPQGLLQMGA